MNGVLTVKRGSKIVIHYRGQVMSLTSNPNLVGTDAHVDVLDKYLKRAGVHFNAMQSGVLSPTERVHVLT